MVSRMCSAVMGTNGLLSVEVFQPRRRGLADPEGNEFCLIVPPGGPRREAVAAELA